MCDETTFAAKPTHTFGDLTRRQFGALSAGAAVTILLPHAANALDVTGSVVNVRTPDGSADCYFVHPTSGTHPGVLVWPDARGLRSAYRQMADRFAGSGYSVLVVNPYYRNQRAPVLPEGATSQDPGIMDTLRPMLASLSTETNVTDAIALIQYLDAQAVVDSTRKLGTTGYCLGGPNTFRTAAQFPDRIGAVGSFHGIRLVTDEPHSPHRLVPNTQAEYLVAIAEDDDQREPQAKHALRESFDRAGVAAEVEVYEDALHSWCTPDSHVYNEAQAERAWTRMLAMFERALA